MKKLAIIGLVLFIGLGLLMGYNYFFVGDSWYGIMPHHGYYVGDFGGVYYPFMVVRALLMLGLFIGLIVLVVSYLTKEQQIERRDNPLDLRLARGVISLEEYRKIKDELGEGK